MQINIYKGAWDLYLHGGPWYFWEDLKKTFIFDLLFKVKKNTLIEIYTKECMYKKVYNEVPNFMYGNGYVQKGLGLIPTWRPMVYFHKTWLIVLFTHASCRKTVLKVCFERSFLFKEKLYNKGKGTYTL